MPVISAAPATAPVRANPSVEAPAPGARPDARPADHFEANPVASAPAGSAPAYQPPGRWVSEIEKVNAFKLELEEKKRAKEITSAIMTCLTPLTSRNGPIEVQMGILLMRIMAKMEARRKEDGLESSRAEELKKALKTKEALKELGKVQSQLKSEQQARLDEQNRAVEGLSTMMRMQNEAIAASLREMQRA